MKAPITLETTLELRNDGYGTAQTDLPAGSTGTILKVEDDRVFIEWCYVRSDVPWASELFTYEWVDLDDWGVWNLFGYEDTYEG